MAAALKSSARTLGDLLGGAAGAHASIEITDLVLDSRQATPGAAFVAVRGRRDHGLRHAEEAVARGASIVLHAPGATAGVPEHDLPAVRLAVPDLEARVGELARAFFGAAESVQLTGVTGTNGKTTVAWLIAQAMTGAGERATSCGYLGTLGYGVPPALESHALTTPDCFTLHRELRALGADRVALEVSSHALAQDRVAGLDFHTAVFTNLTRDHLDEHGDFAAYGRAKSRLFRRPELRCAVLNLDDAYAGTLAGVVPGGVRLIGTSVAPLVAGRDASGHGPAPATASTASLTPSASASPAPSARLAPLRGRILSSSLHGLELEVEWQGRRAQVGSSLVGDFNAANLLSALGALLAWGVPLEEACRRLAGCRAAPGRMEVLGGESRGAPWVVIDYAHTPDALERALSTLKRITGGSLWCVFGCGGERDPGKRPLMGAAAAKLADHIVLTDDNPRGEDPMDIVAAIRAGAAGHPRLAVERDRKAAIARAVRCASLGDAVLIAGKGHETVQHIGAERRPFSDRSAAMEALRARGERS